MGKYKMFYCKLDINGLGAKKQLSSMLSVAVKESKQWSCVASFVLYGEKTTVAFSRKCYEFYSMFNYFIVSNVFLAWIFGTS